LLEITNTSKCSKGFLKGTVPIPTVPEIVWNKSRR